MKKERTSIEKSHSKMSNFKLTLILAIGSISFFAFWVGLFIIKAKFNLGLPLLAAGGVVGIIALIMIKRFIR